MLGPKAGGLSGAFYGNAYILLALTTLMWGGNAVAGRMAIGEVSPMALVLLRWAGVVLLMGLVSRKKVLAEWPVLRQRVWFLFALGGQFQNIGVQHMEARTGTMLTIGSSAFCYWLASPIMLNPEYFLHPAALIFVALGFVRPALSANLSVAAIRHIGPTLTTTLAATSPLFGAAFGILILGEVLTWQIGLGTFGILCAVLILSRRNKKIPASWPLWALALPVGAAMIRSFGHGFTKIGMEYIPDPYFASLVGFSVSFLLTSTLHLSKGGRTRV